MRIIFVKKNFYFLSSILFSVLLFSGFSYSDAQIFSQNGKVVVIGFGIGHADTLEKTSVFGAQTLLKNSVIWASGTESPKILLLVDYSIDTSSTDSKDPAFIEDTLSDFSIVKKIDSDGGINISDLENYDLVIWSGESNPLRSPLISNTPRALLEFFESGHGVILISDDATWDSAYGESSDPKSSSEITRSLTQVTTVNTGLSRTTQTIISTFEGDSHPIMNGILRINISSEKNYSNDIDDSLPGINAQVLATNIFGNPAVVIQEFTGNRFPVTASDDSFIISEDSLHNNFFVLYNDLSQTGKLSISSFDTASLNGFLERNDDHFSFIPDSDFTGNTSFSYFIQDDFGNQDVAIVDILVNPVNDVSIVESFSFSIPEDSTLRTKLLAHDVDNDTLNFSISKNISPGTGIVSLSDDGRIVYTPAENFVGVVTFDYVVFDGMLNSSPASVTISVLPENDDPVIKSGFFTTDEDVNLTGILSAEDPEGDTLTFSLVYDVPVTTGQAYVMPQGTFTYIPAKGFFGNTYFVFEVDDGKIKTQQTVVITVFPKSDPPKAIDQIITLDEDSFIDLTLTGTDPHGYDLSYSVITPPKFGTISIIDSLLQYAPNENHHGTDDIIFEVSNGRFSDIGTISLIISPVNDAPVVIDDEITVKENTETVIPVLFNDFDIDGDELQLLSVESPINGKVTINVGKSISYTPNPGVVNDLEIFDYTVSDSFGDTATGTVIVEILQKPNTSGEVKIINSSFDSDTDFSFDVHSDGKSIGGTISYEDSFASLHLNSENILFFSVDQSENTATFGGISFNDQLYSIFVDDNGDSGRDDVVKIKVRDSEGSLIYQKDGIILKGDAMVFSEHLEIPLWIKNSAEWWANDQITDFDFLDGIQFLISNDIIQLSEVPERNELSDVEIPSWIKNRALWWSEDKLSNQDFVNGLEFLIKNGILTV